MLNRANYTLESNKNWDPIQDDEKFGGEDCNLGKLINTEEEGCMWLIGAAKQGSLKRVQKFVNHGVNINAVDKNGSTALIEAASEGHAGIVNFLLIHGAIKDNTDKHELTALMCACMSGHIETACILVQHGADLNLTDLSRMTALDLAVENGHVQLLTAIAAQGLNIGSVKAIRADKDTVKYDHKQDLSWLGVFLTRHCISPNLVRLCEEKLVQQEGFGSPVTLTRISEQHFHRTYLASLGITALGLCEILLTLHADLHNEFKH